MTIWFALQSTQFFRYLDPVVRELCAAGHQVVLLFGDGGLSKGYTDRAVEACTRDTGASRRELQVRQGRLGELLPLVRDLAGYANYLRPDHPSPLWEGRWATYLDERVQKLLRAPRLRALLAWSGVRSALILVDRWAPPDSQLRKQLADGRPDVLVVSPLVFPKSREIEYAKAAIALGIPTVFAVGSWDHLGGKGICTVRPDRVLVWNEEMADDAVRLHGLSRDSISVVGAPAFDYWFDARPTIDRGEFAARTGLRAEDPYVVYLCSSKSIGGNRERRTVARLAAAIHARPRLERLQLLIRPYPGRGAVWQGTDLPASVAVWPPEGDWPDVASARQDLYHTLYYSEGVVGVNTTAMLEAAVIGRPTISIVTEEYKGSQADRAHFQQVFKSGCLETPHSESEAAEVLERILAGKDDRRSERESFAARFFRPQGSDRRATSLYARAIESVAQPRGHERR